MKPLLLFCLMLFAIEGEAQLNFEEVAEGIFLYRGEVNEILKTEKGMVANVVFVIGKASVAVIDTGSSLKQGDLIHQAIRAQTKLPIKYVVNTHVHLDHIFGNSAFVKDDVSFVAHHNFKRQLAARGEYYLNRLKKPWYKGTRVVQATDLFEGEKTIDLGERKLVLRTRKTAHTNNDLTVFDVNSKTLIAGDLVFVDHVPVIDGSITGWITLLTTLKEESFALLIPGHGPVQKDKRAILKMLAYFRKLKTAVQNAIATQMDLERASQTVLADEKSHWKLFAAFHPRNVITVYTELEWE